MIKQVPAIGSIFHVGKDHIRKGQLCHDRTVSAIEGDLKIIALSDGMGVFRCMDLGAQFTVDYIRDRARDLYSLITDDKKKTTKNALAFIRELTEKAKDFAEAIGTNLGEMHCTSSFSIIGPEKYICACIGDSPVFVKTNEYFFILDNIDPVSVFRFRSVCETILVTTGDSNALQAVLIMSDGCHGNDNERDEYIARPPADFPDWFYNLINGKKTKEDIIGTLFNDGYDDCSFAYYANFKGTE